MVHNRTYFIKSVKEVQKASEIVRNGCIGKRGIGKKKQQKIFLFVLCLVLGGTSTYRIVELFEGQESISTSNKIRQQPLPRLIRPSEPVTFPMITDTAVFSRFRVFIDSLFETPEGRKQYEQFLKERPGFLDSLAFAEKISKQSFPNQIKK